MPSTELERSLDKKLHFNSNNNYFSFNMTDTWNNKVNLQQFNFFPAHVGIQLNPTRPIGVYIRSTLLNKATNSDVTI